ncbi:MAG: hypothetical protein J6C26_07890 [Clostridia bacterium]|nr:hypothetical protein [Clostridia bacterium]
MILHILLPIFNGFAFPVILIHYFLLTGEVVRPGFTLLSIALLAAAFALHLFKYRHRAKYGRPRWAIWLEVLVPMAMFYPVSILLDLSSFR